MGYKIAVIGATGRVGREVLSTLAEFQDEAIDSVIALASKKSEGKKVSFGDKELTVLCLENYDFVGTNIAIFCAGYHVSEKYVPIATQAGCIVIDNSSHFRMKEGVPLIIPEINKEKIMEYKNHNIISNPNCTTIQMLLVLHLLHQKAKIKRIVASTYPSSNNFAKQITSIIDFSVVSFLFVYLACSLAFLKVIIKEKNYYKFLIGSIATTFCCWVIFETSVNTLLIASLFTASSIPIYLFWYCRAPAQ